MLSAQLEIVGFTMDYTPCNMAGRKKHFFIVMIDAGKFQLLRSNRERSF
jgi:hypothetical protein